MSDYKELITRLRNAGGGCEGIKMCHDAANAIERLVKERDAAVVDVAVFQGCLTCKHHERKAFEEPCKDCFFCDEFIREVKWEWRGV